MVGASWYSCVNATNKRPIEGTPLRQKLIEELTLRGYSPSTRRLYVNWLIRFSRYWQRSPELLEADHIRGFLLHLHEKGLADSTINQAVNAIRYFYRVVLKRSMEEVKDAAPRVRAAKKLYRAYSVRQIEQLFEAAAADPLAHGFLSTLYHTGMRLNEGCELCFTEIERSNQRILVKNGKGKKDRYTLYPERLEYDLDQYYRSWRRPFGTTLPWLFLGKRGTHKRLADGSAQELFYRYRNRAKLPNIGGIHTLRHSFASHQLMAGICLEELRKVMGHRSLKTTLRYLHHLAGGHYLYNRRVSPLDCIDPNSPLVDPQGEDGEDHSRPGSR